MCTGLNLAQDKSSRMLLWRRQWSFSFIKSWVFDHLKDYNSLITLKIFSVHLTIITKFISGGLKYFTARCPKFTVIKPNYIRPLGPFQPHCKLIFPAFIGGRKIFDYVTNTEIENPEYLFVWNLLYNQWKDLINIMTRAWVVFSVLNTSNCRIFLGHQQAH